MEQGFAVLIHFVDHPHQTGHPITGKIQQVRRRQGKRVQEIFLGLPSSAQAPNPVTPPAANPATKPPSTPAPRHKSLPCIGRGPFKKDLLGGI